MKHIRAGHFRAVACRLKVAEEAKISNIRHNSDAVRVEPWVKMSLVLSPDVKQIC